LVVLPGKDAHCPGQIALKKVVASQLSEPVETLNLAVGLFEYAHEI